MRGLVGLTLALGTLTAGPAAAQSIQVDGSSTVYPISREAAQRFMRQERGAQIEVAFSGTTGGFAEFCAGETAISTPRGRSIWPSSRLAPRTASTSSSCRSPSMRSRSSSTRTITGRGI